MYFVLDMTRYLSPSSKRSDLFRELQFVEGDRTHEHIYSCMMAEALQARRHLDSDPSHLAPSLEGTHVSPPFQYSQLMETSIHVEILAMVRDASPVTQATFQRGVYRKGDNEENWIARWCLWHAFRNSRSTSSGGAQGQPTAQATVNGDVEGDSSTASGSASSKCFGTDRHSTMRTCQTLLCSC